MLRFDAESTCTCDAIFTPFLFYLPPTINGSKWKRWKRTGVRLTRETITSYDLIVGEEEERTRQCKVGLYGDSGLESVDGCEETKAGHGFGRREFHRSREHGITAHGGSDY